MSLDKLDIHNVRNILQASIVPSTINFIFGQNGSGKSSLLEAIFILGRARSFRTHQLKQVINVEHTELIVSGKARQANGSQRYLGVRFNGKDADIHINQIPNQRRHQLASCFPIQIIDPKSYRLLDSGPQYRREFLDWGVFNQYKNFLWAWRNYCIALNQRNALLKQKHIRQMEVWNNEMVKYGTIVAECRRQYLKNLEPIFSEIAALFLDLDNFKIDLLDGWNSSKGLELCLIEDIQKDLKYGYTNSGPHRCDIQIFLNNRLVKDYVSRGQLKLVVLALKLAQVKLLSKSTDYTGCVLIDDFTAEVDLNNRNKLIGLLNKTNFQVFMTATQMDEFGHISELDNCKVFHVEQGQVKQI